MREVLLGAESRGGGLGRSAAERGSKCLPERKLVLAVYGLISLLSPLKSWVLKSGRNTHDAFCCRAQAIASQAEDSGVQCSLFLP